ncbi:MAG: deoxyribose-phosphate aldolase [Gammaproteobacteria bacterium]|nr:deoxyribose-phosphate aldolase [Gammaproteobacteria bacterium]
MSLLNIDNDTLVSIIGLIDLTTLNENDTDEIVRALCQKAITPFGSVACLCIYQQFVPVVKKSLTDHSIKIATVSNFPAGGDDIVATTTDITQSISSGANEIDIVMPYHRFLEGDDEFTFEFISACKKACGEKALLKVILETGALLTNDNIYRASIIAINAGANFIKTSTGKINIGATPSAAESMLQAIHDSGRNVGFKASGGVRSVSDASSYVQIASDIMGSDWVNADHFRLGASALLDNILAELQQP